uniref:TNFR-Cys domain-containing protein n=1 Tax=Astyanax mexicanus TaxID=7994 RepID=A0A8B9LBD8_ASTMX
MDCAEDEYYLHGECLKCQRCPPGQELKQDCGYGLGVSGVCAQCEMRWFKGEWGSHPCRMCQTCRRLNREEITPCIHTHNAVCGDCLPGYVYYTNTHTYTHTRLKCQRHSDTAAWLQVGGVKSYQSSTCRCSASSEITSNLCPHYCCVYESLPLVSSPICSDITSGIISQATGLSDSPSDQHCSTGLYGLISRGQYCAGDQQYAWGNHAPVECSELDFINISFPSELQTSAVGTEAGTELQSLLKVQWDFASVL